MMIMMQTIQYFAFFIHFINTQSAQYWSPPVGTGGVSSWSAARTYCTANNAQLATFRTMADVQAIKDACNGWCWAGWNDPDLDKAFTFVDGTQMDDLSIPIPWPPGGPGSYSTTSDCGCVVTTNAGKNVYIYHCTCSSVGMGFVCETSLTTSPTSNPSTSPTSNPSTSSTSNPSTSPTSNPSTSPTSPTSNTGEDCVWDIWSDWSVCGEQLRMRTEAKSALNGGAACVGEAVETRSCGYDACEIDCVWSDWGEFGECSALCGGGEQQRNRFIKIHAANGGAKCGGDSVEVQACNTHKCLTTPSPTFERCSNDDFMYNVEFVLDESGTITDYNYAESIDFVMDLIRDDVNSVSKVSVLAFATVNDRVYAFQENQDNRVGVINALEEEKSDYAGQYTDTYEALVEGLNDFKRTSYISPRDENLLFLITDSRPMCSPAHSCIEDVCGTDIKTQLDEYNIRVITIGITDDFDAEILACLSRPEDIHKMVDFSQEEFKKIETRLREFLCPEQENVSAMFGELSFVHDIKGLNGCPEQFNYIYILFVSGVINAIFVISFFYFWFCRNNNAKASYKEVNVVEDEVEKVAIL